MRDVSASERVRHRLINGPKKASREETERLVDAFLATHPFTAKQMGQAMGAFMTQRPRRLMT